MPQQYLALRDAFVRKGTPRTQAEASAAKVSVGGAVTRKRY